jgi:CRISPR-associated endonuclease/helicase Cas3
MIDQSSVPIIIRYADNDSLISSLITVGPKRNIMRRLQRYTVTVPRSMVVSLKQKGFIEEPHDGIFIQTIPSLYSMETGLDIFRGGLTTEECII